MAGNARVPGLSQAQRIVELLRTFDQHHPRQNLSQIARRVEIPVGTCHRLLTELTRLGVLTRHPDKSYGIGRLVWELGMLSPVQRDLREVASPLMHDLLAATRQVVNLFVYEEHRAVLLERIAGTAVGTPIAAPGDRLPLHTSAAGKVFLAHGLVTLDELPDAALTRETAYSVVDRVRLRRELEVVRRQGWAATVQEHHHGAHGLAVPVLGESRQVIAALGVVSLSEIRNHATVVPALKVTAAAISRSLRSREW